MNIRYDYANDRIITRKRKNSQSRPGWQDSWTSEHYLNLKTGKYMYYPHRQLGQAKTESMFRQRKYRLPASQFENIIQSSSMMEIGGRNLWKHQIRRIYDVKHAWELRTHCSQEEIKSINKPCECGAVQQNQASIKCYAYIEEDGTFKVNEPHANKHNYLDPKLRFRELYLDPTLEFDEDGTRGLRDCIHYGDLRPFDPTRSQPICDCCQAWKHMVEPTFNYDNGTRSWAKDVVKFQSNCLKEKTCKCIPRRFGNCGCYHVSLVSNRDSDFSNWSKIVMEERKSNLEYQLSTEVTPGIRKVFLAQSPVHHDTGTRSHWTFRENHSLVDDVIAFINRDYPEPMRKHPVLFTGKLHNPNLDGNFLGPPGGMFDPMQFLIMANGNIHRKFRMNQEIIEDESLYMCHPIEEDAFDDGGICGKLFSRMNRHGCALYKDHEQPEMKSYYIRMQGDVDKDKAIIANIAKLLGNSAFGSCITDVEKHREVIMYVIDGNERIKMKGSYLKKDIASRKMFKTYEVITQNLIEITRRKKKIILNQLRQISNVIFDKSKMTMRKFIEFCFTVLKKDSYRFMSTDTDSIYIAFNMDQTLRII